MITDFNDKNELELCHFFQQSFNAIQSKSSSDTGSMTEPFAMKLLKEYTTDTSNFTINMCFQSKCYTSSRKNGFLLF